MISYHIDQKYINMISSRLEKFSWKKRNLAQCRCPVCGDSKKNKNRTRFFFYESKYNYFVKCHNCGYAVPFSKFLERMDSSYYDEYKREMYLNSHENTITSKIEPVVTKEVVQKNDVLSMCQPIVTLNDDHRVVQYVKSRKIPNDKFSLLYYTDNFKSLIHKLDPECKAPEDARLVIPFYTKDGDILAIQGRSLNPEDSLRYVTIKNCAYKNMVRIFGLERFDETKQGYIVEGPIDSLFLDNCLAIAGSDISYSDFNVNTENSTFIFDNEPRNRELLKSIQKCIYHRNKVCLWPEDFPCKDINDMVLAGYDYKKIIKDNTYFGLEAELKFKSWRKV